MPTIPASLGRLWLSNNQLNGVAPDLTGTAIALGQLGLCGGANVVAPSGVPAVDTFAETNDATGWDAVNGCPIYVYLPCIIKN
jgi:hypothetical protein